MAAFRGTFRKGIAGLSGIGLGSLLALQCYLTSPHGKAHVLERLLRHYPGRIEAREIRWDPPWGLTLLDGSWTAPLSEGNFPFLQIERLSARLDPMLFLSTGTTWLRSIEAEGLRYQSSDELTSWYRRERNANPSPYRRRSLPPIAVRLRSPGIEISPGGLRLRDVDFTGTIRLSEGKLLLQGSPANAHLIYAPFPFPVTFTKGGFVAERDRMAFQNLEGRHPSGTLTMAGEIKPGERAYALAFEGDGILLDDPQWIESLPAGMRKAWEGLQPRGRMNLRLRTGRGPEGPYSWEIEEARLSDFSLRRSGNTPSDGEGVLQATLLTHPTAAPAIREGARADFKRLRLKQLPLDDLEIPISWKEGILALGSEEQPMRGKLCRGGIAGTLRVNTDPRPAPFEGYLHWEDVDLESLLHELFPSQPPNPGMLDGHLRLRGEAGRPDTLQGEGRFNVKHARLFDLPLVTGLFNVLWGHSPKHREIREVKGNFLLEPDRVTFKKFGDLRLSTKGPSIVGKGRVYFDGRLDLQFVVNLVDREGILDKIPLISQILNGLKRNVVQITVAGTASSPEISTAPHFWERFKEEIEEAFKRDSEK
jgi:hypothetical protein